MKYLVALVAGAGLAFAFAPYGLYPLAIVSLAVLFHLWQSATPRQATLLGWCYGIGMFGHGVWWVQVSIHQFGLPIYTFSVTTTVLFILFIAALFIGTVGYATARTPITDDRWRLLAVMPAWWIFGEWMRGWVFSGFPWLLLGYSQTDSWLAGYIPLAGAQGASLAVAVLGGCAVALTKARRAVPATIALLVVAGGAGLTRVAWTTPTGEPRRVVLVQGAVPQALKWQREYREPTLELYEALTAPHWGAALVLWPETAVPAFPDEIAETLHHLAETAAAHDTALMVGIPSGDRRRGPYYNSVMLLDDSGQRYDKHHLVPFGEYLPFDRWVRPVLNFLAIPMSDFSAGPAHAVPLASGDLRVGVSICYEDAYASEVIKPLPVANLLVNVSDDAWFGDTIAPHQHLQISRTRALEAGRYLLRATNTGISAIIDAQGRVWSRSPQFETFVLTGTAMTHEGATPFVRFGHVPVLGFGLLLLGAAAWFGRQHPAS